MEHAKDIREYTRISLMYTSKRARSLRLRPGISYTMCMCNLRQRRRARLVKMGNAVTTYAFDMENSSRSIFLRLYRKVRIQLNPLWSAPELSFLRYLKRSVADQDFGALRSARSSTSSKSFDWLIVGYSLLASRVRMYDIFCVFQET